MPRQDKQQKDRDERDEDERDEDERDEDESDEDEDEASDESRDDDSDDDDSDEDESDDDDGEPDEAAQRVAKALGVAEEDEAAGAKEEAAAEAEEQSEEEAAKPNRAARRREEALARRKKRAGASSDDASSAKDKNARAKDLLKRRREQAAAAERAPAVNSLDAGEMVDDALARSASAIGKWLKSNVQVIQWVILAAVVGAGGYFFYVSRVEKKAGEASGKLAAGIAADRGIVIEEDKRSEEDKEFDPRKVFKTTAEQADAEIAAYGSVVEQHAGSGAALLAKLGQGGAYLEKKEFDKAIASYADVLGSALAAADPDVKGRAIEGTAFAKEGKGDLDGALASFKDLGSIDVKGYKELATYHEARVTFAKGDKAKAKELLEPLNTKLTTPTPDPQPLGYLKSAVADLLAQVDPGTTATTVKPVGGGKMPTPEELQEMARKATEALQKKAPEPEKAPAPEQPKNDKP